MKRSINVFFCNVLFFLLFLPLSFAQSEYLDGWVGEWTVRMNDDAIVTWEITGTWVSDTGRSHIAYGIKNPGTVEFQIYYSTFFSTYQYIEASHDKTVYDLPQDLAEYTELVPSADLAYFTAKPGKYPIKHGWRGDEEPQIEPEPEPEPEPCAASYLLGSDDPRLDLLRQFRDENLAKSATGILMIEMHYEKSQLIIDMCDSSPAVKRAFKKIVESCIPIVQVLM
jgi:hypothetical protein